MPHVEYAALTVLVASPIPDRPYQVHRHAPGLMTERNGGQRHRTPPPAATRSVATPPHVFPFSPFLPHNNKLRAKIAFLPGGKKRAREGHFSGRRGSPPSAGVHDRICLGGWSCRIPRGASRWPSTCAQSSSARGAAMSASRRCPPTPARFATPASSAAPNCAPSPATAASFARMARRDARLSKRVGGSNVRETHVPPSLPCAHVHACKWA
jgi:hypothetical protein